RIHAQLHQCGAGSGRFSCDSPNLQQIPREASFRRCFVPAAPLPLQQQGLSSAAAAAAAAGRAGDSGEVAGQAGPAAAAAGAAAAAAPAPAASPAAAHGAAPEKWKYVIADFSQIELRIAADIAGDERMIEAYQKGRDLHRLTASLLLSKPEAQLTKADRQLAKAVNFGLIYGISVPRFREYALSAYGVSLTLPEAQKFHSNFFKHYKGITRWHQQQKRQMPLETRTRSGRRARFDSFSFTKALNYPVQGTSADITKESLALLLLRLPQVRGQLVMCVHDEIIVQLPEEQQQQVCFFLFFLFFDFVAADFPSLAPPHDSLF
ncbi:DNA polymerase I, putative, partial [Eimeria tenella]